MKAGLLLCLIAGNGSALPLWENCSALKPEFILASCHRAPKDWWENLRLGDGMVWARVDKNTWCLKTK